MQINNDFRLIFLILKDKIIKDCLNQVIFSFLIYFNRVYKQMQISIVILVILPMVAFADTVKLKPIWISFTSFRQSANVHVLMEPSFNLRKTDLAKIWDLACALTNGYTKSLAPLQPPMD